MDSFSYLPHKDKDLMEIIKTKFNQPIENITDLNKIFFKGQCRFFDYINYNYKKEGEEFVKIFDNYKQLVNNIENILKPEIPLLKTNTPKINLKLTRKEVALIFLLSFFNLIDLGQEKFHYTNSFCVFRILFSSMTIEFGRCFLNYLTIVGKWLSENNPILDEKIVYIRESLKLNEEIFKKEKKLCDINIYEKGSLFDGDDSYFIDFANMYIGGGVLEGGCVQEEILFAVQPEAIVSMFFMEVMSENDAIRIDNTIRYSEYSGYGRSFKFTKSAIDMNNINSIKRNKFIAIDACVQYQFGYGYMDTRVIKRDIHKAYVGFNLINFDQNKKEITCENKQDVEIQNKAIVKNEENKNFGEKSIGTGNWGCGAFGGDHELKFFQQWIAASFAGVERLDYYTFEAKQMKLISQKLDIIKQKYTNANKLYENLINNKIREGEVLDILLNAEK